MSDSPIEFLDAHDTPIGLICLRERAVAPDGDLATEITINGEMLMSSLASFSEREMVTRALDLHGDGDGPLRVLVGGLGLGCTAHEALGHERVSHVRVVERLPSVIQWMREGRLPLSDTLNGDARLEIVEGDVYSDLLGPAEESWDLILVDVDHSPRDTLDKVSEPFYTWSGQREVIEHLAPGGVLAVWSAYDDYEFPDVLDEVYAEARREPILWSHELIEDGAEIDEYVFLGRAPRPI